VTAGDDPSGDRIDHFNPLATELDRAGGRETIQ
jgi:hypothetical protein